MQNEQKFGGFFNSAKIKLFKLLIHSRYEKDRFLKHFSFYKKKISPKVILRRWDFSSSLSCFLQLHFVGFNNASLLAATQSKASHSIATQLKAPLVWRKQLDKNERFNLKKKKRRFRGSSRLEAFCRERLETLVVRPRRSWSLVGGVRPESWKNNYSLLFLIKWLGALKYVMNIKKKLFTLKLLIKCDWSVGKRH